MSDSPQHQTVLDIEAESFGKTYAEALLGASVKASVSEEVLGQLGEIVDDCFAASPQLAAALASPRIDEQEKIRIIDRLFGDQVHPLLLRFLKVMARRGRLMFLSATRDAAVSAHDRALGRVVADVRTAVALDDGLREELRLKLAAHLGREVRLQESIDESLVGGMVIRVGDTVYDSSVAGRIAKIGRAATRGFAQRLLERSERFATGS